MAEKLHRRLEQNRFESLHHEAVLNLMLAAAQVNAQLTRVVAEHGITTAQFNVLRILRGAHPGGYPRCEIARRMIERSPDVTRLIDRLEKQELVERERSGEDRRLSITHITRKGLALLDRLQPAVTAVNEDIARRIPSQDARELSRICEGLYDVDEE